MNYWVGVIRGVHELIQTAQQCTRFNEQNLGQRGRAVLEFLKLVHCLKILGTSAEREHVKVKKSFQDRLGLHSKCLWPDMKCGYLLNPGQAYSLLCW